MSFSLDSRAWAEQQFGGAIWAIDGEPSTSLPVTTFADAWQIVEYYELRWLIEEFHKAFKTGSQVQN
ncbi:MAG TPA: hypothetical protein PKC18_06760 [Lacipirellulaceae bacterium]|nr:hypothetical protein [Lacipirellulaceae bacterium]HMP05371.1 hypothetical protein [Lacipirellulaceae bacterium]